MADALSVKIDDLITVGDSLSDAADSIATITSGSDVLVSNFDHVKEVFDNLQSFFEELKNGSWYAPVGLVSPFAGSTAPLGWLLCNGSAVSQATYADLYAVLGVNAYGTDGGGNFYLPDFRGRVVVGLGTHVDVDARADSDGIATLANRSPKHSHSNSFSLTAANAGGHAHTNRASTVAGVNNAGDGFVRGTNIQDAGFPNTNGVGDHSHSVTGSITVGVGSGTLDTMPYGVANYIIKA